MSDTTYNGWTNRETWLVNVWFNPESKEDVARIREYIDQVYSELPDFVKDFCDFDRINWEEIESHFDDEDTDDEEGDE